MDEIEWWEFDSARELAEQAAGDIGFVTESAIEAHGGARLALPGEDGLAPVFSARRAHSVRSASELPCKNGPGLTHDPRRTRIK